MKNYSGYDVLTGGLFLALALVLPVLFHAVGLGSSFLPMFFPLLAAGFLTALPVAVGIGVTAPLVSALLTGMPPFFPPIVFIMMAEGAVLGALPALLYRRLNLNPWLTASITVLADRLVLLVSVLLLSRLLELPGGMLTAAALIKGLPGAVLLVVVIPPLVKPMDARMRPVRLLE